MACIAARNALNSARPSRAGTPNELWTALNACSMRTAISANSVSARSTCAVASAAAREASRPIAFRCAKIGLMSRSISLSEAADAARQQPRGHDHADLDDRDHQRRDGDDPEKELRAIGHTLSRVRAC